VKFFSDHRDEQANINMCFMFRWFKKWKSSQQPVDETPFKRRQYPQLSPCKQNICENRESLSKLRQTAEWILRETASMHHLSVKKFLN